MNEPINDKLLVLALVDSDPKLKWVRELLDKEEKHKTEVDAQAEEMQKREGRGAL